MNKIKTALLNLRCELCKGSGAQSTPSVFRPCPECEGTGMLELDGSFNDIFPDL